MCNKSYWSKKYKNNQETKENIKDHNKKTPIKKIAHDIEAYSTTSMSLSTCE